MKALSIRQPWAWLIVNGHKPVENRTWRTKVRGRIAIHASAKMTRLDWMTAGFLCQKAGIYLPPPEDLPTGGIVGYATVADCVDDHPSLWFTGPHAFVMEQANPSPLIPCKGKLGFFEVEI